MAFFVVVGHTVSGLEHAITELHLQLDFYGEPHCDWEVVTGTECVESGLGDPIDVPFVFWCQNSKAWEI